MAFVRNMPDGVGIRWIYDVTFGVGPYARNHSADVQLVQHALNTLLAHLAIPGKDGQPIKTYLKRDGIFGPRTAAAIRGFQTKMRELRHLISTDGRVDPSSPDGWTRSGSQQYTIVYLNRTHRDLYGKMMDEQDFPEPLKSNVKKNPMVG